MQNFDFIAAMLALRAYQDGFEDGLNGMLAVAFTIRNQARAGWWNGDYVQILNHHADVSAYLNPGRTDIPDPRIYSVQCLIQEVNDILSGKRQDNITQPNISVHDEFKFGGAQRPNPSLYYARLDKIDNPWFLENISRNVAEHPRVAQVGMMVFFS